MAVHRLVRLARTFAPQGEQGTAPRAIAAAEHHLNDARTERPTWCAYMSDADLAVDTGQALLDLGDTTRAHQLITEGEHLLPAARDKTRGVFLAYRAPATSPSKNPQPPRPPPPNRCSWHSASAHPGA
ncbi:hypothetical protein ABT275_44970 [Streptomyces sp. NPDC001185]|uniref:hypothetical protein n=1 Tax=Streptomyces sp. NPDC001185 TaxID=3154380 RepID=UPI00331FE70C